MADTQAGDIRFFDASSRIGRLRAFVYPLGVALLVLPFGILAGVLFLLRLAVPGGLLLLAIYVFIITMQFVFMVRRLHDMNRSGWWSLVYAVLYLGSIVATLTAGGKITPVYLTLMLLSLGFALMLWFTPGTAGENRFGPPPPPNSTWIVVGAWSYLVVFLLGGILAAIAIPAYQDFVARAQMAEAIELSNQASNSAVAYYRENHGWPTNVTAYNKGDDGEPAGRYTNTVSVGKAEDGRFVVTAVMKNLGVNRAVAGKSIEQWYDDDERRWHCGPGGPDPVAPRYVPASCRDTGAP